MFWHLTNRGKLEAVYYWLRRRVVHEAPDAVRCWMGAPVDPMVHCPRVAMRDSLWCVRHQRAAAAPAPPNTPTEP